jgi:hypothetical protein
MFRRGDTVPIVYKTQADLKDMSAEQIINLNPQEVSADIAEKDGGIPLRDRVKKLALYRLVAIKKQEEIRPDERTRQKLITSFLQENGIIPNPEVDRLIANTQTEMVQENMAKMREQLELKDMTNRLRALDNKPPIPDTEEESMVRRVQKLGGKRKRTVSKGKRKGKTRKGRKGRKTNRRK